MKYIPYLYIGALTFLIACSSEERITTDSNEEPSGTIELSAGIAEGNSKATTRTGAEDHHTTPGHQTFTSDTKIALRVSGTWTGHGESPYTVVKTTTATVGAETSSGSKHNSLTCSPLLYWDDYGSADPANSTTGRTTGLTIYGAAVNGQTSVPTDLSTIDGVTTASAWEGLSWTLPADQSSGWSTKDLLISNNISGDNGATYQNDYGRYLFDQRTLGKLLEFKHAMSKITVVLTAGAGFIDKNSDDLVDFTNDPEVLLTSNVANSSTNPEWACTKGNVNITSGGVTLTGTSGDPAVITMGQASSTGHVVTKEALVMPGSQFTADDAIIARINADGNIYYVTAKNIRAKIAGDTKMTEAGKNYIINVTVNKTDIVVTATVANWTNISADEVAPVINVSGNLGGTASGWTADNIFSFYRSSTSLNSGYSSGVSKVNGYYPEESVLSYTHSPTSWSMSPSLYWPNHNTHYQFRAVWPQTGTGTGEQTYPRVEDGSGTTAGYQVIKVENVAYSAGSFPSDLMIARPEIDPSTLCTNKDHTNVSLYNVGICATEGTINLNFRYMMSQVEVNLSTTTGDDKVKLEGAVVEIVKVYNTGDVRLGDREVIPTGSIGSYKLNTVTGEGNANKRWSAIVPQSLTYDQNSPLADGNTKFRISIKNEAGTATDDIYYADINPILKQGSTTEKVAPNGKWESGKRYVYDLRLTKTNVQVTATLANWTEVTASQTVWF